MAALSQRGKYGLCILQQKLSPNSLFPFILSAAAAHAWFGGVQSLQRVPLTSLSICSLCYCLTVSGLGSSFRLTAAALGCGNSLALPFISVWSPAGACLAFTCRGRCKRYLSGTVVCGISFHAWAGELRAASRRVGLHCLLSWPLLPCSSSLCSISTSHVRHRVVM